MSRTPFNDDPNSPDVDLGEEQSEKEGAGPEGGESNELIPFRAERDELFKRLARTTAEFQNARKRLEADKEQAVQYANSALIKSLIPVIDNFERALAVDPSKATADSILKGMGIVHDQWLAVLQQQSVQAIAPEAGTPFDPSHHQAIMQMPDDRYKEPTVTQLLQKGYTHQGRVLRPAQVAVSKVD